MGLADLGRPAAKDVPNLEEEGSTVPEGGHHATA
jgi:hypothetical protein